MSWTPIFWLLAFIPALIALYFLRLKRQRVVVSSNLLWMRAVEDLHVNAPFQRLRRNLLLILQLIILIALILALWRPQTAQLGEGGANLVVLIDVSASMEAKGDGGETPLAVAKRRAVDLIRTMGKADRMVLMTFAQRAEAVLALTGNKERLERAVNALSAVALPSDLRQALVVAASLAQSMGESKIYVLGDGCYEDLATLPNEVKGQRIEFLWDTKPRTNVGIIEIDTRHNFETDRRTEVTVLVENFGDEEWSGTLSLEIDGNVRDAEAVTIEPGGSKLSVFDLTSAEGSVVQASIDSDDALPADNRAWVRLHRAERISATLVGDGNPLIEMALTAAAHIEHSRMSLADYDAKAAAAAVGAKAVETDVLIFDRGAPAETPAVPSLFVACRPRLPEEVEAKDDIEAPVVIDWDRTHPVTRFLVFANLRVAESTTYATSEGGYRSLLDADKGSLIGIIQQRVPGRPSLPFILIGFDIWQSNWPNGHYSFPIFFADSLSWLMRSQRGVEQSRFRSGEALRVHWSSQRDADAAKGIRFRAPSGKMLIPNVAEDGSLVLASARELGIYDVVREGEVLTSLPVGLLNATESRLHPREKLDFGAYEVTASAGPQESLRELWKWFAALALLVVVTEWLIYNRRLAVS